ncbi:MAG: primase C-terminal domain-containing protein [Saprospiraceae bacterium]|nr:primase C-terminal domain-containing protein [Saprospiraceae bacterium]
MITVFNNIKEVENPFYREIDDVLDDIKSGVNKDKIQAIRSEENKETRNKLKQSLRSICFSGKFSRRAAKNCVEHSGFACLDFDDVDEPDVLRDSLADNEYIYSAFISPSGNGVKAIFKIPQNIQDHKKYYEAMCETFDSSLDAKTKDIARVCYESYDPELFINHDAKVWELKKDYSETTIKNSFPEYFQVTDTNAKVDYILNWFNKKFTLNAGERNNNLFKLASALNRAGASKEECMRLFRMQYSSGLKETELQTIADSAYKNTAEHNTLTVIDDKKVRSTERLLKQKGAKAVERSLKREGVGDDDIEDVIDYDFDEDYLVFWNIDKNGKISTNDYKFKLFLENRGFYKVQLNDKEFTFVKVYNNVINEVNETNIKDFILNYVIDVDIDVYNYYARTTNKFSENYLNMLDTKELTMLKDTADCSYLFFKNKVVKVEKDNVSYIEYADLDGFVWQNSINKRSFSMNDDESDFAKFISNVSANDENRLKALECSIGYLLNSYKKQNEGVSVIYYDETLEDNPSGRTGKTLISKAISEIRTLVTLNGKEFDNKGNFPYDTVNLDTSVIVFDDMERSFKFESLFSIITGDLTLKKKFQQPIVIPYEYSPKILFTSNYILSGVGDSHEDRKLEFELHRHYNSKYKPVDEFGKLFFSPEWDDNDWNKFFTYMVRNIQKYLNNGLIRIPLKTGMTKKLIANTSEDFYNFCENEFLWQESKWYQAKDIMNIYHDGHREHRKGMTVAWFSRWVGMYISYKKWDRDYSTTDGTRKFMLTGIKNEDKKVEINNDIDF